MQVGRFNTIPDPKYALGGCLLSNLTSARDLGVTIDNKLSFNAHVSIITGRAHAYAYLFHTCFISKNTQSLVQGVCNLHKTHSCICQQYLVTL